MVKFGEIDNDLKILFGTNISFQEHVNVHIREELQAISLESITLPIPCPLQSVAVLQYKSFQASLNGALQTTLGLLGTTL